MHKKSYEEQVKELDLPCKPSTEQFHVNRAGARRFKKGYTSEISEKNVQEQVEHGHRHKSKTLTGF
jgi:hypothetical protein